MRLVVLLGLVIAAMVTNASGTRAEAGSFKSDNHFGVGVATCVPSEWMGFSIFSLRQGRAGVYFDLKTTVPMIDRSDYYYEHISVGQAEAWGDRLQDTLKGWISVNGGITYILTADLAVYGGLGYSGCEKFRQYYDEFEILGDAGEYWVKDGDGWAGVNVLGGVLLAIGPKWGVQAGMEAKPQGVTAGVFRYW